ncbi:hypothetical protein MHYP_G00062930 [Metynnis hypsauchen]
MLVSAPQARPSPPQTRARCPHQLLLHIAASSPPRLRPRKRVRYAAISDRADPHSAEEEAGVNTPPGGAAHVNESGTNRPQSARTDSPCKFNTGKLELTLLYKTGCTGGPWKGRGCGGGGSAWAGVAPGSGATGKLKQRLRFRFPEEAGGFTVNRNSPPLLWALRRSLLATPHRDTAEMVSSQQQQQQRVKTPERRS